MTKDNKIRFTLRIPKKVYERLAYMAAQKGIATNSEISNILWQHVQSDKTIEKAK